MFEYVKEKLLSSGIDLDDNSINILVRHIGESNGAQVDEFLESCIRLALASSEEE